MELDNDCTLDVIEKDGIIELDYDYNGDGVIDEYDYYQGEPYNITKLTKGTCSDTTEALFRTSACINSLREQPSIVRATLEQLVLYACREEIHPLLFREFGDGRK